LDSQVADWHFVLKSRTRGSVQVYVVAQDFRCLLG